MRSELPPLTLARHSHDYRDPGRLSFLEVVGLNDDEGGTVEVRLSLMQSSVPSSEWVGIVLTLTRGEARELSERLCESAKGVGYADVSALGPVVPRMVVRRLEDRRARGPWRGGCSSACAYGHVAASAPTSEAVAR